MSVHLMRVAHGISTMDEFNAAWRASAWAPNQDSEPRMSLPVRVRPTRAAEALEGGSMFWVLDRMIRVRQPILGISPTPASVEWAPMRPWLIALGAPVETMPQPHKHFRGWRYLEPKLAPIDCDSSNAPPPEMAAELRHLGLI